MLGKQSSQSLDDAVPDGKIVGDYVIYMKKLLVQGKGKFGEVYEGFHKGTNLQVAVKVSPNTQKLDNEGVKKILEDKEMQVLQKLKHENLIHLYDFRITTNNIYLMIEYCNGGSLQHRMKAKNNQFDDIEVLRIVRQISQGFKYLYENKIMHRDLKPDNIMFHNDIVKISDFGFARMIEGDPNQAYNFTLKGTPLYLPPQIFDGQKYSSKFDIWSLGAIMFELMFKGHYVSEVRTIDQLKLKLLGFRNKPPQIPPSSRNPKLLQLLGQMLQYREEDRISWEQIFEHDFFTQSPEKFLGIINEEFEPSQVRPSRKAQSLVVEYSDDKIKINSLFTMMLLLLEDLNSIIPNYRSLQIKCYIIQCQILRTDSLQKSYENAQPYVKDFIKSHRQLMGQQLLFHHKLLKVVSKPLIEFQMAMGKTDDQFLVKVVTEEVQLDDILRILPQNNDTVERLKLGLQISNLMVNREHEITDIEALCDLQPITALKSIYAALSK